LKIAVTAISDLDSEDELLPHYYSNLNPFDKSIFDFSTKTESQKQQLLVNFQKKIEIMSWENIELKKDSSFLNNIINSIGTLVYCKNRRMKFSFVNHRFLLYFGFSDIESVLGRRSSDIWTGQYKWIELEELEKRVFENKIAIDDEVISIPRSFGQIGTGTISIKPVFDSSGEVENIICSLLDTTGEQVAKKQAYYTETVLDKLEHVIWIIKKEPYKHYIYVNNAVGNLYKINKSEFYINVNKWLDFIHKDDKKRIKQEIMHNSEELIYRIQSDDKSVKWVKHFLYTTAIGEEEFEYSIVEDITETKKAQEKMELLEINVEIMKDGLAIVENKTQKYLYLNKTVSRITGYSLDLLYEKGHDFWKNNIIAPVDRSKLLNKNNSNRINKLREQIIEYRIIKPDGTIVWVQNVVKNNKINGLACRVVTLRDISSIKEADLEVQQKITDAYNKGLADGKSKIKN